MKIIFLSVVLLFGGVLALPIARASVTLGQVDTFQDGTTDNWGTGGTAPANVPGGGPAGAGDSFLELTADGSGANGKLTVFNRSQWLGDYIDQGINEIDMDLENLGSVTLNIRIAYKSTISGGTVPGYLSAAVSLPADGQWHAEMFQLTAAAMIPIASPAAFNTFFSNGEAEFRVINEAGATNLDGTAVTSQLGIDNIGSVPEPGATSLLLVCAGGLALFRGRFVRRPVRGNARFAARE
jgi:hypothetical protein